MAKFYIDYITQDDQPDLEARVRRLRLNKREKEMVKAVIKGGFAYGENARFVNCHHEAPAGQRILELEFEGGVDAIVKFNKIIGEKKRLIFDLASYAYNEGYRMCRALNSPDGYCDGPYPKSFSEMLSLVA